jgi:voltage-gated potassium channel
MIEITLIGVGLVTLTVMLHAVGTTAWVRFLAAQYAKNPDIFSTRRSLVVLTTTVVVAVFLHAVQILIWAKAYLILLPEGELHSLEEAVYFSFVTFTTLGYGDITLSEGWRLLSGIEALNGILLVGWTTALLFMVVQRVWETMSTNEHE